MQGSTTMVDPGRSGLSRFMTQSLDLWSFETHSLYTIHYLVYSTQLTRVEQLQQQVRDRYFFFRTLLLSSFWTSCGHRCRPFSPLVVAFNFSSSVAISRSRAFRKSICAQEKVPTNLHEGALGGIRTQGTDLCQARG